METVRVFYPLEVPGRGLLGVVEARCPLRGEGGVADFRRDISGAWSVLREHLMSSCPYCAPRVRTTACGIGEALMAGFNVVTAKYRADTWLPRLERLDDEVTAGVVAVLSAVMQGSVPRGANMAPFN